MNRSVLAACAVVSLAGTSFGFQLITFGQPQEAGSGGPFDKDVRPSSGSFRFAEVFEGSGSTAGYVPEFTNVTGLVTGSVTTWQNRRADINNSSWFAFDVNGPDGAYSLGAGASNRPAWNANYGSSALYGGIASGGGPGWVGSGDGDNLVDSIDPGLPGWAFALCDGAFPPPPGQLLGSDSNVSPLGGVSAIDGLSYDWAESFFVGHFALTDSNAVMEGTFLITIRNVGPAAGFEVNLDGTPNLDMKLVQVRDGSAINLFLVEVPAPGALAVLGSGALLVTRRRR